MLFVVQFEDVYAAQPHRLPERAQHMADHLAFLAGHGDRVIAAGALPPSADGTPTGGIWIINAESHAAAETFYKNDPFWKARLRKSVRVSHWAKAYWSPAYAECMRASGIE